MTGAMARAMTGAMLPGPVIDVAGVTKRFGDRTVVNGLSLRVEKGEIFGFLGPNGSGKTTFLRMLCGLLTPDAGSGTCLGLDVLAQSEAIKRQVGYMAQKFSLYADLTVRENLDFLARVHGLPHRRQAVDKAIETMLLSPFARQLAGSLSGGWKQRLALAASCIHDPPLLLLDEPTAGVDPKARRDFWDALHLLAGRGVTALVTTHYMDEAQRCHRVAYLAYGDLLAQGTVAQVVAAAGLTTWEVDGEPAGEMAGDGAGPDLHALADLLRPLPGVDQVAHFGATLHVSGQDAAALKDSLDRARLAMPGLPPPRPVATTLEEVFIHLMRHRGPVREDGGRP